MTIIAMFRMQTEHEALGTSMSGMSKFVEARALDLRLQSSLAHAKLLLERPPLSEAKKVASHDILSTAACLCAQVQDAAEMRQCTMHTRVVLMCNRILVYINWLTCLPDVLSIQCSVYDSSTTATSYQSSSKCWT